MPLCKNYFQVTLIGIYYVFLEIWLFDFWVPHSDWNRILFLHLQKVFHRSDFNYLTQYPHWLSTFVKVIPLSIVKGNGKVCFLIPTPFIFLSHKIFTLRRWTVIISTNTHFFYLFFIITEDLKYNSNQKHFRIPSNFSYFHFIEGYFFFLKVFTKIYMTKVANYCMEWFVLSSY